jgi:large subunit ribosomal protein L6
MSRVGKQVITIPAGTTVSVADGVVAVKGKKGDLSKALHPHVAVTVTGSEVTVAVTSKARTSAPLAGTFVSHIKNMIAGVNEPFTKKLILEGVGYKVALKGTDLVFDVGFSHDVHLPVPQGITAAVEKEVITIAGADKEAVGQFAANIRAVRKPEPYKGKGIRYDGEVIRRKEGKKAGAA